MNNTPSPIVLTPEQKQRIYNEKAKHFMDGLRKLTEETGLYLVPKISYTEHGNIIIFELVERTKNPSTNNDNSK